MSIRAFDIWDINQKIAFQNLWLFTYLRKYWGGDMVKIVSDAKTRVQPSLVSSDNDQRQAIIWTKAETLSIGLLGTNFSTNLNKMPTFSLKNMPQHVVREVTASDGHFVSPPMYLSDHSTWQADGRYLWRSCQVAERPVLVITDPAILLGVWWYLGVPAHWGQPEPRLFHGLLAQRRARSM